MIARRVCRVAIRGLPRWNRLPLARRFCREPRRDNDDKTPEGFEQFERKDKAPKEKPEQFFGDEKPPQPAEDTESQKKFRTIEEMKESIEREFEKSRLELERKKKELEQQKTENDKLKDYDFWKKKASAKRDEAPENEPEKKKEGINMTYLNKKEESSLKSPRKRPKDCSRPL